MLASRVPLLRSLPQPCRLILCKHYFHQSHVTRKEGIPSTSPGNIATTNHEAFNKISTKKNVGEISTTKKHDSASVAERIAEMAANSSPDSGFEIEVPRIFPPRPKRVTGTRQKKRMRVRSVQRRNDHKKYLHTRPTRDSSRVNSRHLSLPPEEIKPKFPVVVIPRLRQIEYEKLALVTGKKVKRNNKKKANKNLGATPNSSANTPKTNTTNNPTSTQTKTTVQ
eukprot:Phypoly_transcript_18569.p1 GENE.Phypoly_transcript_18569~~Phypoly_transcript_18569.p1  ORF type:complete len:224 (+),score=31.55 Phypoly_transcript_18569:67-738(+)